MSRRRLRWLLLRGVVKQPSALSVDLIYCALLSAPAASLRPIAAAAVAYMGEPFEHSLSQIACPTLVVWGVEDRLVPPDAAHEISRRLGAPIVRLAEAAHLIMMEQPEQFAAAVAEFVRHSR
jgi:pimeloyl-ACP methyl ester carboxylesterase